MESEFELEAETRIVFLFNPLNENFTHSFDGHPIMIPAGETVPLSEPEANLLARHVVAKEATESDTKMSLEAIEARVQELISDEPPENTDTDEEGDEVLIFLEDILNSIERFCMICAGSLVWAQGCEDEKCELWEYRPEPEEMEEQE